jgi:hypothetical protein
MVEYLADRDIPRALNAPNGLRLIFGRPYYRYPAAVAKRRFVNRTKSYSGAPRPMKMGNIPSP